MTGRVKSVFSYHIPILSRSRQSTSLILWNSTRQKLEFHGNFKYQSIKDQHSIIGIWWGKFYSKVGCVFSMIVVSIQYRLYCSIQNSDEMTIGKTRPTLHYPLLVIFLILRKLTFVFVVHFQTVENLPWPIIPSNWRSLKFEVRTCW